MDSVAKEVNEILNTTEPVYIDVIESNTITPTYDSVETLWKYFFDRNNSQVEIEPELENHLKKFPVLTNLFKAHCSSVSKHLFLLYCCSEENYILLRYKKENTYHFLDITSPSLVDICQGLVQNNPQNLGLIIWVN